MAEKNNKRTIKRKSIKAEKTEKAIEENPNIEDTTKIHIVDDNEDVEFEDYYDNTFKAFYKKSLDKIRDEYFRRNLEVMEDKGKDINNKKVIKKANNKAYKEVKKIYNKYYAKLRDEQGIGPRARIKPELWTKAEGEYQESRRAKTRILVALGLGALIGVSATKVALLPAGTGIEQEDKRTPEEKGDDVVKKANLKEKTENTQKSKEASDFEKSLKVNTNDSKENAKTDSTEKANNTRKKKETPEEKKARLEKEENDKFYDALLDEYNSRNQTTQAPITKADTAIIETEGTRNYTYYGIRNDGEIMYVDDMSKTVDQATSVGLQYDEAGRKPYNYVFVLDKKNKKIIVTTASVNIDKNGDGKTEPDRVDIVSNYYQGSSNTVYTNPAGDDINKALTTETVLTLNRTLFEGAKDSNTEVQRATKALLGVKEELEGKEKASEEITEEAER